MNKRELYRLERSTREENIRNEVKKMIDKQDFGVVEYKGKTLSLTQYPYINYHNTKDYYVSHAVDDEENEYMVYWDIINADAEDESDCCDWEDYKVAQI